LLGGVEVTKQEIFNTVVAGLAAQRFIRSMRGTGCSYRGAEGRKCAAGFLISDEQYRSDMEGYGIKQVIADFNLDLPEISFISSLQGIHDGTETPRDMKRQLVELAIHHSLTIPKELEEAR
jgi:hypothetical protein